MARVSSASTTSFFGRVIRRWYITVAGILVTVGLCIAAVIAVPVRYSATADILIIPPATTAAQSSNPQPNPLLDLFGLSPLADVLARSMTSGATLSDLRTAGMNGDYTITQDPNTNSPVLIVAATGSTPAEALHNLQLVEQTAPTLLAQLQNLQSIPLTSRADTQVVSPPTKATTVRKSQIRALVVAAGAGLLLTALAVRVLDTLLLRRSGTPEITEVEEVPEQFNGYPGNRYASIRPSTNGVSLPPASEITPVPIASRTPAVRRIAGRRSIGRRETPL